MESINRQHWKFLWQECVLLHSEFDEFSFFFSESQERVELLNKVAGDFFKRFQKTAWENILLRLCRLTDPPRTGNKENLSLKYFLQETPSLRTEDDQRRAENLVAEAIKQSSPARSMRNSRIAHWDLPTADGAIFMGGPTLAEIKRAVLAVGIAMDALDPDHGKTYWDAQLHRAGCKSLIRYLQEGYLSRDQKWSAFERGEIPSSAIWLKQNIP